jgi:hypothetical protein
MQKTLLIIILLYLTAPDVLADLDLYTGEIPVSSQDQSDRDAALPDALTQVLQKLSGQRELPASPVLEEALSNAGRILRSYRYTRVDLTGADGSTTQELRLVARFMQPEVDRIVQQVGLPRWRQERPAVQLWVVVDDGFNRRLMPLEYAYAWESMEQTAILRGLPVGWPELDEEEVQLLDMRLVWGGFTDYLVERGAPADGVAIIAARRVGPQWTVRWNLANESHGWSWQNMDVDLVVALQEGIHHVADQVAAANAIAVSDQGIWSIDLTIGGLSDAKAYARCMDYLQNLSLVNAVDVLGAEPGRVHFRLQLNASKEYLTEAFRQGTVLLATRAGSEYEYEYLP